MLAFPAFFLLRARLLGGALLLALAGTATAQFAHAREQTRLELRIAAADDVNQDEKGQGAPIAVRIYELKSEGTFQSTDYFSLQKNDKAVLGDDMLVRDEFVMRPGEVRVVRRWSHPDVAAIGVIAGYKNLAQSDWRAVQKIDPAPEAAWYRAVLPANKAKLQIQLQARGIRIVPLD